MEIDITSALQAMLDEEQQGHRVSLTVHGTCAVCGETVGVAVGKAGEHAIVHTSWPKRLPGKPA